MAVKIVGIIPQSNFEKSRDQIGIILHEELSNQVALQALPYEILITTESLIPEDESNKVQVNILIDSAAYTSHTQSSSEGIVRYFLDVSTSGEETDTETGSEVSSERRDKTVSMICFIFRSAFYRQLDLPPGAIGNVTVESFANLDPYKKEDSSFTTFSRIVLAVKILENSQVWSGVQSLGDNTSVKLELSNKGYKFVFNS